MAKLELKKKTGDTKGELLMNSSTYEEVEDRDTAEDIAAEIAANITKMEITEDEDNTLHVESSYSESFDEKKEDNVTKAFEGIGTDFTKDLQPTPMYIFDGWYSSLLKSTPEKALPELGEFKENFRDFVNRTWQILTKPIIDDINLLLDDIPESRTAENAPDEIWKLKMAFSAIQKDMMIAEKGFYRIRDFMENLKALPSYLVPKKLARENPSIKNAIITKFTDFCVLMKTIRRRTLTETIKLAVPYGVKGGNFIFVNSFCRYYLLQDLMRVFIYKDDDPKEYSIDYSTHDAFSEEDIILEMEEDIMLDDIPENEDMESDEYPSGEILKKPRNSAPVNEASDIERTADFEWQDDDKYDRIWKGFLDSGDACTLTFRKDKHRKMLLKMAKEVNRIAKKYNVDSFMIIADEHAFTCNANRNKYTKKALKNFIKEHNS